MKTFTKFYSYILRYPYYFAFGLVLTISTRIVANYANFFFRYFLDAVSVGRENIFFVWLLIGYITINLLAIGLNTLAFLVTDVVAINSSRDVRLDVFKHLHNLDFSYHATKQSGSLISAIKRGDGAFFTYNHQLNRETVSVITDAVFVLITFFAIDKILALIVLIILLAHLILTRFLILHNVTQRKIFNKEEDELSGFIVDNLLNYETVKLFAREKWELNRLTKKYKTWATAIWNYSGTFRLIDVTTGLLITFASSVSIIFGLSKLMSNQYSIGEFALILTFVTTFFPKLTSFVFNLRDVAKFQADLDGYMQILDQKVQVVEKPNAIVLPKVKGEIRYDNISFQYPGRDKIIDHFSLTISPGESVAFVGLSGAGKTTLVKLLLRFYDVTAGQILIDGIDIRDVSKASLRRNIGVVPQEPILFNDSIAYNIGYPQDEPVIEEIREATRLANLDSFISGLPQGYDTLVGERGIKLSGGQKQRLAISRMFLADPPVIVFDEATSQLDSESERAIQDAFWKVAKGKTTIIVAHRLSTVMKADRIVVIEDGKIIEAGSHSDLIQKKSGIYNKLWDLQRGGMLVS